MPGSERLRDSAVLDALLKEQLASDKLYSAICAAPAVVLESKGLLVNKKATAHPGFVKALTDPRQVHATTACPTFGLLCATTTCMRRCAFER